MSDESIGVQTIMPKTGTPQQKQQSPTAQQQTRARAEESPPPVKAPPPPGMGKFVDKLA